MNQSPVAIDTSTATDTDSPKPFSKLRIIKNLVVVSMATFLIICTNDIMILFQSSMNRGKGLGVISIAMQSVAALLSSLFLPRYLILKYGCKITIVISILLFVPFFAANYYPMYPLMVLSAVLLGVGLTLFWGSVDTYLNNLSNLYVDLQIEIKKRETKAIELKKISETNNQIMSISGLCYNLDINSDKQTKPSNKYNVSIHINRKSKNGNKGNKSMSFCVKKSQQVGENVNARTDNTGKSKTNTLESTTSRFFGFHSMIYQSGYILSSAVSFVVLRTGYTHNYSSAYANVTCSCGSAYCNVENECSERNLQPPSTESWNILISVCVGLSLLAAVIAIAFIDGLKTKNKEVTLSLGFLLATCRQIKKRNHILLAPLIINNGMMKGFYIADFTKSYVSCAWGIQYVGLVAMCTGATMAIFSTISGWFVKYLGRVVILMIAAILNIVLNVIFIMWQPNPNYPAMFFIAAGMWGGLFGTFYTQVRAFYGVLFKDEEEAAFGAYQSWFCVGACLSLSYNNLICMDVKIYVMTSIFVLGTIGYFIVERSHSLMQSRIPVPFVEKEFLKTRL